MVVLGLLVTGLLGAMLLLYFARMLPGRALVWHADGMRTRGVGGETAHRQDGLSALQRDEGAWLTVLSPLGAQRFRCTSSEAADLQRRFADAGYDLSHHCFALRKERGTFWYCIALFAFLFLWIFLPVNAVTTMLGLLTFIVAVAQLPTMAFFLHVVRGYEPRFVIGSQGFGRDAANAWWLPYGESTAVCLEPTRDGCRLTPLFEGDSLSSENLLATVESVEDALRQHGVRIERHALPLKGQV
jgi:hypothetical protein